MDREHIISEITRTATENGGVPLGRGRFAKATGIRESDWRGLHWARWSDAVREAGFQPNKFNEKFDDDQVLQSLLDVIESSGKWPTYAELRLHGRTRPGFPDNKTFGRLGSRSEQAQALLDRRNELSMSAGAVAICEAVVASGPTPDAQSSQPTTSGYVYLLKSGKYHKIGHTNDVGRRVYDVRLQLPEKATVVHQIKTDDAPGIEAYWHRRFADQRANGEWFSLSAADVAAFKSRRSM